MSSKNNPILKLSRIKVGITLGDPAGVGPIITAKAIKALEGKADFIVIGDKWVFKKVCPESILKNIEFVDLNNVDHKAFRFGKLSAAGGKASIEYLDKSLKLLDEKRIDCLVTCPISKSAINLAGYHYSGHTEYFAAKTKSKDYVMMLLNDNLKFSLLTRHIPINRVSSVLSKNELIKTIRMTQAALKRLFSIKNPRIVICGLNPHASDNGVIGDEENRIIKPALRQASFREVSGPISADVAIFEQASGKFDCAIAMYHDQALIPLKLTDKASGVNLTLGLPFVRTSPLHGTGFDIAANPALVKPQSLIAAIKLAIKCRSSQLKA